jgi:hypothetical protein
MHGLLHRSKTVLASVDGTPFSDTVFDTPSGPAPACCRRRRVVKYGRFRHGKEVPLPAAARADLVSDVYFWPNGEAGYVAAQTDNGEHSRADGVAQVQGDRGQVLATPCC